MTSLIVDKRIVESVLKAVPTKSKSVNHSRALKITEGGWLLAFSGDGEAGFVVKIAVDTGNVAMPLKARGRIEPGFYSRDVLARWVHPMGGETPKPLTEGERKYNYPGGASGLPRVLEPFAVDDLGHRETVTEPGELMLPLLCLAPALKIKCVQTATPIKPPKPLTALHVGWEKMPKHLTAVHVVGWEKRPGSGLWVVAWHSNRLRVISMPAHDEVPQ